MIYVCLNERVEKLPPETRGEFYYQAGITYSQGLDGVKDEQTARTFFVRAADCGHKEALQQLAEQENNLTVKINLLAQIATKEDFQAKAKILDLLKSDQIINLDQAVACYYAQMVLGDAAAKAYREAFIKFLRKDDSQLIKVFQKIMADVNYSLTEGNPCLFIDIRFFSEQVLKLRGSWELFFNDPSLRNNVQQFRKYAKKFTAILAN